MGLFKGVEQARVVEGGNYLEPGIYDLEVVKATLGMRRAPFNTAFVAISFKVTGSNNEKHPIGSIVDWFVGADKEPFLSNCKTFAIAGLSNALPIGQRFDEKQITEELLDTMFANNGELITGWKLKCQVDKITTKGGKPFSRHRFSPNGQTATA